MQSLNSSMPLKAKQERRPRSQCERLDFGSLPRSKCQASGVGKYAAMMALYFATFLFGITAPDVIGADLNRGYVLVVERGKWENGGLILSSTRTIRAIEPDEISRFQGHATQDTLKFAAKSTFGSGGKDVIDGGTSMIEWLIHGKAHLLVDQGLRSPTSDMASLVSVVDSFYDLAKDRTGK